MAGELGIKRENLVIKACIYALLVAGAVPMAIPYIWMFLTSIKPIEEIQAYPPSFMVHNPTLEPYRDLFKMVPMGRYIFNSFFVAISITIFNVFATSLAGYAFAKHRFWGRDKLFFLFIASLMIPWQVNIIPGFVIVKKLGWLNTYRGLIIPAMAWCAFGIFLNRQYIYSIPDDLIDAAKIDGCSEFMIYRKVILPLIRPVLATLAIFTFLQQWNNFVWPLLIIHTSEMRTLPLALAVLTGQFGANFGMVMAGAVVTTLPMLIVYLIFQKYIIKGISLTGLKRAGRKDKMKRAVSSVSVVLFCFIFALSGCSPQGAPVSGEKTSPAQVKEAALEEVTAVEGEELMYLPVTAAEASSFDQTPDWAPEPNPMAPVDGDMLTRWSSDYIEGPQWISFDLGQVAVVSDVIIRWERAHATKYQILGSIDGKSWKVLKDVVADKGGAIESSFSPVKIRYLKILGLERVNPDWGISIWEAEIYGPKGNNPQATVTKTEYLSKGEDEALKKEAEEVLNRLAAPVIPIQEKPFQKGVVYTSWMGEEFLLPTSDMTLGYLKELGFDTVAIMVPAYQDKIDSKVIFTNDTPDGDTPTDEALIHAIKSCHKIGLRVLLKPHVDPRTDEARINIMPSEEWFASYKTFALRYAKMAQENNVEIYSVGTELEATTFEAWKNHWNDIIEAIKGVYTGILTYSANWTEYKEVPFWDKMDFIGLDAYFPLSEGNTNPTQEDLVSAWEKIADDIEAWRIERGLTDKGVILTEIGYPSADKAAQQPWVAITNVEDQEEQAACLEAVFSVLTKRDWFKGYYIWQYFPQDRWSPLGFTVKGKKAEEVIKNWLSK